MAPSQHRYRTLPVAVPGSPQSQVDAINTIREALLTLLGSFDPADQAATYTDLVNLGLFDPQAYQPRVQPYRGVSSAQISGTLTNAALAGAVWASMPFGTVVAGNDRILKTDASGLEVRVTGLYFFNVHQDIPDFAAGVATYNYRVRYLVNGGSPVIFIDNIGKEDLAIKVAGSTFALLNANDVVTFEFQHTSLQNMNINHPHLLGAMQLKGDPVQSYVKGVPQPR